MSQTLPISAASKKRLDEKNSKLLRELAALPGNRNCAECGQRGPTYVDITVCSFICSACSGILRGLNPPHRIKSISMATFTSEEIEKLREGGNEVCNRQWMGMFTEGSDKQNFTTKEERERFIRRKYEKKEWFVSAAEVEEQRRLLEKAHQTRVAPPTSLGTTPQNHTQVDFLSTDPFSPTSTSAPPPSISLDSVFAPPKSQPIPTGTLFDVEPQPFSPPGFIAPPPPLNTGQTAFSTNSFPTGGSTTSTGSSQQSVDFFAAAFNAHTPTPFTQASLSGTSSAFADFDTKFGDAAPIKGSSTMATFGTQPSAATTATLPKSSTTNAAFGGDPFASFGNFSPVPQTPAPSMTSQPNTARPASVAQEALSVSSTPALPEKPPMDPTSDADKYSALAELDQLFNSSHISDGQTSSSSKPTWVSTGFSAPAPATTSAFASTPTPPPPPPSIATATLAPVSFGQMQNGVSKSSTMGGIASHNYPMMQQQQQPMHAYSQMSLSTNPFLASSTPAQWASPTVSANGGTGYPTATPAAYGGAYAPQQPMSTNPFTVPSCQMPVQGMPFGQTQNPFAGQPNWNPFLS